MTQFGTLPEPLGQFQCPMEQQSGVQSGAQFGTWGVFAQNIPGQSWQE